MKHAIQPKSDASRAWWWCRPHEEDLTFELIISFRDGIDAFLVEGGVIVSVKLKTPHVLRGNVFRMIGGLHVNYEPLETLDVEWGTRPHQKHCTEVHY